LGSADGPGFGASARAAIEKLAASGAGKSYNHPCHQAALLRA
jgi:hypothetical protein